MEYCGFSILIALLVEYFILLTLSKFSSSSFNLNESMKFSDILVVFFFEWIFSYYFLVVPVSLFNLCFRYSSIMEPLVAKSIS